MDRAGREARGRSEDEPAAARCRRCFYVVTGLESPGICPECASPFDLGDPTSFTTRAPYLGWVFWMPGLLLAVAGGTAVTAIMVFAMHSWGYSLWFGVPLAAGCILGYRVRSKAGVLVLLALVLLLGLIFGFASLSLAGVFCGLTLGVVLAGPVIVGMVAGATLRASLKRTRFSQREYLPVLIFLLLPLASAAIEGRPRPQPPESIETSATIGVAPERAWDSIVFYEEVKHLPPWILRIGLAHPLYTLGQSRRPGDVKTCVYNKGHITKRITEAERGRILAFDVVDQDIGYGRDVRLIGGSFRFERGGENVTRVTLTTTYEPLLTPRWCWRPFETVAVHTLHNHVLEGMRRNALDPAFVGDPGP